MNSEMPTKLNADSCSALVSPDKLSVKANKNNSYQSVQSNKPVPMNIGPEYYFEMRVKNGGSMDRAAIGYTPEGFDLSNFVGYSLEPHSVGYHGDDGKIFHGRHGSELVSTKFTTNDIVGAGMNYTSNEFFFTVKVNFGHKPFVYDIKTSYPCPYNHHRPEIDDTKPSSSDNESWKKLMEKNESLLMKSLEEKEKEVASLKAVIKTLTDNFAEVGQAIHPSRHIRVLPPGIHVYEYEGDLQNVSDTIHGYHWKHAHSISSVSSQTLEVHGVKFTVFMHQFDRLISGLTLTGKDGITAIRLMVNRNGVCFVNVSEDEWVRANDGLFSWAKHGVKIPEPRGSETSDVLGMVNGAVSELLSLRERSKKLMEENDKLVKENEKLKEETVSFLEEVASLKSVLKEKEEVVESIKVALNALVN
ncbi:Ran-binding protein M homolog [Linum perenne]